MKLSDLMPPRVGYAGLRSLAAFLALATLGAVFYIVGLITSGVAAKGVGVFVLLHGAGRHRRDPIAVADLPRDRLSAGDV